MARSGLRAYLEEKGVRTLAVHRESWWAGTARSESRAAGFAAGMADTKALQEFRRGLALLRSDYPGKALGHVRRAAELEQNNPVYLSYLGLLVGRTEKRWRAAERLCRQALRLRHNQAQFYLNLAEVYGSEGRKEDAVEVLTSGLQYTKRDVRLTRALGKLGLRRAPVLSFLGRKSTVNRRLGKLRHRALKLLAVE